MVETHYSWFSCLLSPGADPRDACFKNICISRSESKSCTSVKWWVLMSPIKYSLCYKMWNTTLTTIVICLNECVSGERSEQTKATKVSQPSREAGLVHESSIDWVYLNIAMCFRSSAHQWGRHASPVWRPCTRWRDWWPFNTSTTRVASVAFTAAQNSGYSSICCRIFPKQAHFCFVVCFFFYVVVHFPF